jgi:hypothetical protein
MGRALTSADQESEQEASEGGEDKADGSGHGSYLSGLGENHSPLGFIVSDFLCRSQAELTH